MTTAPSKVVAAPRRLLFISHSREVGGAEVYLENLLRYLAETETEHHWRPQLVCRRDAALDGWAAEISKSCAVFRLDVVRPRDALRLATLVRQAELVHLNLSFPAGKYQFAAASVTRMLGRPLVVTHHLALKVSVPWRWAMGWLGHAARRHIAVSERSRKVLVLEFGYPLERVVVVHNGIDTDRFRPAAGAARHALRQEVGESLDGPEWGEEVLLACTVARLSPQKGLFELVEATSLVVKDVPAARVVVIGEGDLRGPLVDQVKTLGLAHCFFLAGSMPRQRVAEWLAAADLFILPSHYEGGPATALMEAMACGCAVVTTDVSGVDELITDETLGIVVPPRDPKALAAATVDLLTDPSKRAAMAERARRKVIADFTIDVCLRRTMAVFDAALAEDHARAPG